MILHRHRTPDTRSFLLRIGYTSKQMFRCKDFGRRLDSNNSFAFKCENRHVATLGYGGFSYEEISTSTGRTSKSCTEQLL